MLIAKTIKDQHDKMSVQRNQCICGCKNEPRSIKMHKAIKQNVSTPYGLHFFMQRYVPSKIRSTRNTIRSAYEKSKHSFTLVSSPKSIVSSATKKRTSGTGLVSQKWAQKCLPIKKALSTAFKSHSPKAIKSGAFGCKHNV